MLRANDDTEADDTKADAASVPAADANRRTVQVSNQLTPMLTDSLGVFRSDPVPVRASSRSQSLRRRPTTPPGVSRGAPHLPSSSPSASLSDDLFSTPPTSPRAALIGGPAMIGGLPAGGLPMTSTPTRLHPSADAATSPAAEDGSSMVQSDVEGKAPESRSTLQAMRQAYVQLRLQVVSNSG